MWNSPTPMFPMITSKRCWAIFHKKLEIINSLMLSHFIPREILNL